jgi:hypothetical protein
MISAAVHILAASLFVVTFPIDDIRPTPVIVFLGAILRTSEIVSDRHWQTDQEATTAAEQLPSLASARAGSLWSERNSPGKPAYRRDVSREQFKSAMEEFGSTALPAKRPVLNLGVDLDLPPRVPLKLYYHD